jgi:LMBR1 domain-containing protein 1
MIPAAEKAKGFKIP